MTVGEIAVPKDVAAADTELAAATDTRTLSHRLATVPPPGERIGRYAVLEVLGRGGMGVVISAYDPELDRRVAIKLVSASVGEHRHELRERLLREARAMAKIRHPNVVAVYEVGEHEGQVYLAMEQVEGGTLKKALDGRADDDTRDWRAILADFIAAGRGLAAAHAAGIVHRDFKPENVFVDRDGRVLVGDFGLVGAYEGPTSSRGDGTPVHDRLTRNDIVMGTPAYMAPEQHTGELVDARADQFSFCVGLYEALYGELPFAGDSRKDYLLATVRGEIRKPPPGRRVPSWLRAALVRGLSAGPADRHRSMEALLVELGADPSREWRRGRRERVATSVAAAGFTVVWAATLLGLDIELSYAIHYTTNLSFLAIMLVLSWIGRRVFARTAFNRKVIGLALMASVVVVALAAGGHALSIPPDQLGILHLIVVGSIMATAAVSLDSRLGPSAGLYLVGFLIAAAWPSTFFEALLLGHTTAAVSFFVVLNGPRPT